MLENELKSIATELDQLRKTTNTKRSYPEELKQKVISIITQGLSVKKSPSQQGATACQPLNVGVNPRNFYALTS